MSDEIRDRKPALLTALGFDSLRVLGGISQLPIWRADMRPIGLVSAEPENPLDTPATMTETSTINLTLALVEPGTGKKIQAGLNGVDLRFIKRMEEWGAASNLVRAS